MSTTMSALTTSFSNESLPGDWDDLDYEERQTRYIEGVRILKKIMRDQVWPEIVAYSVILLIGAIGNLRAFFRLMKRRHLKKPINVFMAHLTFADLLVIFLTIPIEIMWRVTISWDAGLVGCKLLQTLRAFGLYLSSWMLVSISFERYHAIVKPLHHPSNTKSRNRFFLALSWGTSLMLSFPQVSLFSLLRHSQS